MAPRVAKLMVKELNKNRKWVKEQIYLFNEVAKGYLVE
jgi:hypothetical protein